MPGNAKCLRPPWASPSRLGGDLASVPGVFCGDTDRAGKLLLLSSELQIFTGPGEQTAWVKVKVPGAGGPSVLETAAQPLFVVKSILCST